MSAAPFFTIFRHPLASVTTFEALETIQVGSGPLKIAAYTAPGRSGPQ